MLQKKKPPQKTADVEGGLQTTICKLVTAFSGRHCDWLPVSTHTHQPTTL